MTTTVASFADVLSLLGPGMELFHYSACDLSERYGEAYEADAVYIFQKLADFARLCGDDPRAALASYASWVEQAAAERSSDPRPAAERPGGPLLDAAFRRRYLYALTLSTVFNRSRYELLRHFRRVVAANLPPGAKVLEIGAGNCLDAAFASRYGQVSAYEMNDLSRVWLELLDLAHRVDLRIEEYRFDQPRRFDFVAMVELLEHVADPARYLEGASRVLRDEGLAYFTFAIRMPQFDHLTELGSIQECRDLLSGHGFAVRDEQCLVDTYLPFAEGDRWQLGEDPRHAVIYSCLAHKDGRPAAAETLYEFNREIE